MGYFGVATREPHAVYLLSSGEFATYHSTEVPARRLACGENKRCPLFVAVRLVC